MNATKTGICLLVCVATSWAGTGPWRRLALAGQESVVSSIAVGEGRIAIGLNGGAVRLVDPGLNDPATVWDPVLGSKGKVWSLAWHRGDLWIAAGRGLFQYDAKAGVLDKTQRNVPEALRTQTRVLREQGGALWCASTTHLVRIGDSRRSESKQWALPIQDEPTCLAKASGRILVGTYSKGFLLLDSATGEWSRFGREEGLASDQVTGLEWIGDQVYVGTPEGIYSFDLSTRQVRHIVENLMVAWLTQVNGVLMTSSVEGLYRIDPTTMEIARVALPNNAQVGGDLRFGMGVFAVGGRAEVFARDESTVLGREPLRTDPDGFRLTIPAPPPKGVQLRAFLRIPEWPAAKVPMEAQSQIAGRDWMLKLPVDIRGNVQVDLVATKDGRTLEVRSLEGNGDRSKPVLDLDPFPKAVRDSTIEIAGSVSGSGALKLVLRQPENRTLKVDSAGRFRFPTRLAPGENRLEIALEDGIGNLVSRAFAIRRVDRPPELLVAAPDTVETDFARIKLRFKGAAIKVGIRPDSNAKASLFDSFVVVEARALAEGRNSWNVGVEDEVGNVVASQVVVVRRTPSPSRLLDSTLAATRSVEGGGAAPGKPGTIDTLWKRVTGRTTEQGPCVARSVHVVKYYMEDGETIRRVALKFYGTRELDTLLIVWNGFLDSARWRRMPIGTLVEVPFWTDLDQAHISAKTVLECFPWEQVPAGRRRRR